MTQVKPVRELDASTVLGLFSTVLLVPVENDENEGMLKEEKEGRLPNSPNSFCAAFFPLPASSESLMSLAYVDCGKEVSVSIGKRSPSSWRLRTFSTCCDAHSVLTMFNPTNTRKKRRINLIDGDSMCEFGAQLICCCDLLSHEQRWTAAVFEYPSSTQKSRSPASSPTETGQGVCQQTRYDIITLERPFATASP